MISNLFNFKFVSYIISFGIILGLIIYLSNDVYHLALMKINADEYAISKCPDGEKIRIKNSTNLPLAFQSLKYEVGIVTEVTDGDTIELGDCRRIRYLGIDTPETVHPDKPLECYGPESSNINKQLVLHKKVLLFKGNKDKDMFGRSLRYVVLVENSIFINDYLVENGFAKQCDCQTNETKSGTVLDPFGGSGTTGIVAAQHNRNAVLLELNKEYIELAKARINMELKLDALFSNIDLIHKNEK